MYLLPVFLKKYKTSSPADCIIRKLRANTVYQYNNDGLIKDYNPNDLLFRNEKGKGLYLKDQRDLSSGVNHFGGGTTAVFVEDKKSGGAIISTISYYGWQQSIVLALLIGGFVYVSFYSQEDIITVLISILIFNLLFALTSYKTLQNQRLLIERIIAICQEDNYNTP